MRFLSSGVISISRSGFSVSRCALALMSKLVFFFEFGRSHLLQIFFQALETLFDLAEVADHQVEFDVLDVAQRIDRADVRDGVVFKGAQHVGEGVDLAQVADVGGLLQRFLADGADVDVLDGGVGELLGVVEGGQAVQAVVGNLGDADVRLARIGQACAESAALVSMRNRDVLPTCGRPMMPVFIGDLLSAVSCQLSARGGNKHYRINDWGLETQVQACRLSSRTAQLAADQSGQRTSLQLRIATLAREVRGSCSAEHRAIPGQARRLPVSPTSRAAHRIGRVRDCRREQCRCRQTERAGSPSSGKFRTAKRPSAASIGRSSIWRTARGWADPVVEGCRAASSIREKRRRRKGPSSAGCSSECPTRCRPCGAVGATEKAVGASTNERKMIPPIQTIRERNMRKRRMDMGKRFSVVGAQFSVKQAFKKLAQSRGYWLILQCIGISLLLRTESCSYTGTGTLSAISRITCSACSDFFSVEE